MLPNYTQPPTADEHTELPAVKERSETYALRQLFIHIALIVGLFSIWLGFKLFEPSYSPPDLSNYVDLKTLDALTLDLDNPNRRLIIVGDLHGMLHSLDKLLSRLEYDPSIDLLIHLGDLTTKGPHSNELVTRFAAENITGVRGNNDQKVIEWYGWFEWVKSHEGGQQWLLDLENLGITPEMAEKQQLWRSLKYRYPKEWIWAGDHYHVARKLSESDYAYLTSLPIVIHLPSIHTFLVHAGLLPIDPAHHLHHPCQPLAVAPSLPPNPSQADIDAARYAQEVALLTDVQPNTDPFIKLNIRDIYDLEPSRRGSRDNEPWSDLWNSVIKRCHGFDVEEEEIQSESTQDPLWRRKSLPCHPITVVYGHASARGLDLKKWSKGLDTGCAFGHGLTAMVLGKGQRPTKGTPSDNEDERDIEVKFGEGQKARIVSVSCPLPPPIDD